MKKMTFAQFQATRRECDNLGEALQDEVLEGASGLLYVDSLYIERGESGYCLTIGNFSDLAHDAKGLERFERKLYAFAKSEGYCDLAA